MLENNEQLQGMNVPESFNRMITELPWASLLNYIQSNAQIMKMCTIGGHRLVPDKRKRFENVIVRDAEKAGYGENVTNGVFAQWYPVHKELHQQLEDYFHSSDYEEYRKSSELGEDVYVLPDDKFDAFYKVDDLPSWKILICFSPLRFSESQLAKLMDNNQGNEQLLDRITGLEASNKDLARSNEQLTAEAEKLRARQAADATELQELKKQLRQLKQDNESLTGKLDSCQAEARRTAQQVAEHTSQLSDTEKSLKEEAARTVARIQSELDRATAELKGWQSRYDEQCQNRHRAEDNLTNAEKAKAEMERLLAESQEKIKAQYSFVDSLLARIDWPKVGTAMKLTPTMRRNFNSLIKKLDYSEERALTIEGTLPEFWGRLSASEGTLIDAIAKSNMNEVASGSVAAYWEGLRDTFADVQLCLEARLVMLGMLQDIFFQTIETDSLTEEKPAPAPKSKKKSE